MQIAQGWSVGIDRGPDWLFVTLRCDDYPQSEPIELAENLWDMAQRHLVNRVVLDLNEISEVTSALLGQLALLGKRLHASQGVLRLCGVTESDETAIRAAKLDRLVPCYADRGAAVRGERPPQPR